MLEVKYYCIVSKVKYGEKVTEPAIPQVEAGLALVT